MPVAESVMYPGSARDDAADASFGFQCQDWGKRIVCSVDVAGVDAGKREFGMGAGLVAE
jgi:hypothetical protein